MIMHSNTLIHVVNGKMEAQWCERTSLFFELVPCEGREKDLRTELTVPEREEGKLVTQSKLLFCP